MNTVQMPPEQHRFETKLLYPGELVGTAEIHEHVPHLPVYVSRFNPGRVSVPFGDYEGSFDKLGILVDQTKEDEYGLTLFSDEEVPFPNYLDHRFELSDQVGRFAVNLSERPAKRVKAFNPTGAQIELKARHSRLLSGYLVGAIDVARIKNDRYNQQKKI